MKILIKIKSFVFFVGFVVFFYENLLSQTQQNQVDTSKEAIILIKTDFGSIKIRLSNETPLHRNNFLKLAQQHFYDSLLFHRIIAGFMIQAGDPYSKHAKRFVLLGDSDIHYTIPAEITPNLFHKRGMLCAARDGDDVNPLHASSGCQFYITQGRGPLTQKDLLLFEYRINKKLRVHIKDSLLQTATYKITSEKYQYFKANKLTDSLQLLDKKMEEKINAIYATTNHYTFTPQQINAYEKVGGTPHLDGNYTVFGEVLQGMDVVDKISIVNTDTHDRPLDDVRMTILVVRNYKQ